MRSLIAVIFGVLLIATITACKEEKKEVLAGRIDPELFPTMKTINVETLISDSGITRYRITAPLWLVFDESRQPYWSFPKKLKLEKYNDLMRIDATVECDSARYFKDEQLWRLDGHVTIANVLKEKFLTQQLYWDQRSHKIYSDSFIHIEKTDRIIEGYGFQSDEQMTNYSVNNVAGIFPVSENGTLMGGAPAPPQPAAPAAPQAQSNSATAAPAPQPSGKTAITPAPASPTAPSPAAARKPVK